MNGRAAPLQTTDMTIPPDSVAAAATVDRLAWTRVCEADRLPPSQRYEHWRDSNIAGLSEKFDTRPDEPFTVQMDWLDLGTLGLGTARITAADWVRGPGNARRDGYEDLVVSVRHRGAAIGDMAGREAIAPTGSILIADMAQVQRHYSEASLSTGFAIPRAVAERMLAPVRSLHGHVIAPDHARLLVSHIATIQASADRLPISSGPAIAQTVVDLFAMSLAASMGGVPGDPAQHDRGLRLRLCDAIERQLGSPSLTAARLSRDLAASRSTLYRLLQDEGGVQAYIRTRRLARVAEGLRLADGRETIGALAERWGFCDAAYLGRAFREAYGMTPGDYRAMHRRAPTG